FGEVQVMDWGLAKTLASEGHPSPEEAPVQGADTSRSPEETQEGAVLGTPAYMAPEQARGEIDNLDERADVFGLGAVLCVLLTGQPPCVGPSREEVQRLAMLGALGDAYGRLDRCGADADLVTLAKVCLSPQREERPRHAGAVAEAAAAYQARV